MQNKAPTLLITCILAAVSTGLASPPNFRRDIQPILETHCVRCHNAKKTKGGLRMDTYPKIMEGGEEGEAIVPGKPEKSELIRRTHLRPIDEGFMPDEGQKLNDGELELLTEWVKDGAPWPDGITLHERTPAPVKRVALPKVAPRDLAEAARMLDDLVKQENADEDVMTTPVIDDDAFLRRVTVDLIGRIPTMREIAVYEGLGPDRRQKLIERLAGDSRFADRWTIFLADLLRIRSNLAGGNELLAYVNQAIATDKPYDVLVRELIGSSGRPNVNPAVGYILGDNTNPMELAAATSQVLLGVRIGCAMCHDHPFDDWVQKDFYELAAFFGKTTQVRSQRNQVYTTEGHEMMVLWPPENKADPKNRKPVKPRFPFSLVDLDRTPHFVSRFEQKRKAQDQAAKSGAKEASLEALLDSVNPARGRKSDPVLEEAKRESENLNVLNDIYRASELRNQLADLITSPRNGYFARAFVNRIWAELVGHGFVEPLDNFSSYNELRHASTLEFLAQEFIANGYDIKSLVKIITMSDAYQRSHLSGAVPLTRREHSEKNFAAAPVRRMLSEVLYDSVVVAGHLDDFKWPEGANLREVIREIRVPTGEVVPANPQPEGEAVMMTAAKPPSRSDGYDLESTLSLDFGSLLEKEAMSELDAMRRKSDEQIEAEKMSAAAAEKKRQRMEMVYRTEKVVEMVDDNPRFGSAMRMATPAPSAHFLRVFGQPSRDGLGEFRDDAASLRQQLMMMNGRVTHEASRVGPKEPLHRLMERKQFDRAINWAYQEILTRYPTSEEKAEASDLLTSSKDPKDGMADLRWALLNSHEFRYLP